MKNTPTNTHRRTWLEKIEAALDPTIIDIDVERIRKQIVMKKIYSICANEKDEKGRRYLFVSKRLKVIVNMHLCDHATFQSVLEELIAKGCTRSIAGLLTIAGERGIEVNSKALTDLDYKMHERRVKGIIKYIELNI